MVLSAKPLEAPMVPSEGRRVLHLACPLPLSATKRAADASRAPGQRDAGGGRRAAPAPDGAGRGGREARALRRLRRARAHLGGAGRRRGAEPQVTLKRKGAVEVCGTCRRQLKWPMDLPHAHYTTRRGSGQVEGGFQRSLTGFHDPWSLQSQVDMVKSSRTWPLVRCCVCSHQMHDLISSGGHYDAWSSGYGAARRCPRRPEGLAQPPFQPLVAAERASRDLLGLPGQVL